MITDRAKRYRANSIYRRKTQCECTLRKHGHGAVCGSRDSLGVGHKDGDESNNRKSNLFTVCKSCNAMQAHDDKRAGRGVRTRQYNPKTRVEDYNLSSVSGRPIRRATKVVFPDGKEIRFLDRFTSKREAIRQAEAIRRKNPGATNLAQYVQAAMDHSRGAHDAGGKVLHETPKAKRKEFAREIWWRRGYRNPRGRAEGELEVLDKDPHTEVDYEPRSKHLPEKCANCAHFIPANPPRCQTVKSPINSAAWCERYDPRGKNPASEVMREWRSGTLRSSAGRLVPRGKAGEAQARAILLSELRREGKIGPRQNPSGSADELYRKFHGVQPDNHLVFDVPPVDPYGSHPEIAQFGLLVRLVVGEGVEVKGSNDSDDFEVKQLADNAWAREISFVPSLGEYKRMVRGLRTQADVDQMKSWLRKQGTPDLAGAPDGEQIYIVGGNQNVGKYVGELGADDSKEFMDLGFCYMVEYFTQKRFDQMSPIDYYHAFGEKTHVQPRLIYWRKIPMLQLVGGEYTVKPAGITN